MAAIRVKSINSRLWVQHNKSFFVNFANSVLDIGRALPHAAASLRETAD
jgi:hypothetical protein